MNHLKQIGESLPGFAIALLPLIVEFFGKDVFERTVTHGVQFGGLNDRRRVICNFEYFTTLVSICVGVITLAIVALAAENHQWSAINVIVIVVAFVIVVIFVNKGTEFFSHHKYFALGTGSFALALKIWEFLVEKKWV